MPKDLSSPETRLYYAESPAGMYVEMAFRKHM